MTLPVRDRSLAPHELERFRLLLSTFKDGSGQRVKAGYMPDFLAFERVTAYVLGGNTMENKGIFDVVVPGEAGRHNWGVSCKMATVQQRCWFMELSNSAKKLNSAVTAAGTSWLTAPQIAGPIIVQTVCSWHEAERHRYDLDASRYLLLTHCKDWHYFEIASFNLNILTRVPADQVNWRAEGAALNGYIAVPDGEHRLWQWYANSGGQLKLYPPIGWEQWRTGPFELLQPPVKDPKHRVLEYWPDSWPDTQP